MFTVDMELRCRGRQIPGQDGPGAVTGGSLSGKPNVAGGEVRAGEHAAGDTFDRLAGAAEVQHVVIGCHAVVDELEQLVGRLNRPGAMVLISAALLAERCGIGREM